MKPDILTGTAVLVALFATAPVFAHHSAGVFDTTTPIRVKGTVVQFTWANPHSVILVEEKTADGATIRWALESSSPLRLLERNGFSKDSFRPGDVIEACGFAPKAAFSYGRSSRTNSGPAWLADADRVITARLLLTPHGPEVDWSHYGPLESCISEAELQQRRR